MNINQLFIKIIEQDSVNKYIALQHNNKVIIKAEEGQAIFLTSILNDTEVGVIETLAVVQSGDDLNIIVEGKPDVVIIDYAKVEDLSVFVFDENGEYQDIAERTEVKLDDGNYLLFVQGEVQELSELVEASYLQIQIAIDLNKVILQQDLFSEPQNSDATSEDFPSAGVSFGGVFSALSAAGVFIAGANAAQSNNSNRSDNIVQAIDTIFEVSVGFGPVLNDNTELSVAFYKQDGTLLGISESFDSITQTFSFTDTSGYEGILIVRLIDEGPGSDYMDEATLSHTDAMNDLLAITNVMSDQDSIFIALTPLTHLAVILAGIDFSGGVMTPPDDMPESMVTSVNTNIAEIFGVTSVIDIDAPIFTIDSNGESQIPYPRM